MVSETDLLKLGVVVFAALGLTLIVAGIQVDGTSSFNPLTGDSEDGETRYSYSSSISVASTGTSVELKPDTFKQNIEEQGILGGSLTFTRSLQDVQASLTTVENVEVKYTLNGPVDRNITKWDSLGDIGRFADSKQSSFEASNLPCGSYVVHMNLLSSQGEIDYFRKDFRIQCSDGGGA